MRLYEPTDIVDRFVTVRQGLSCRRLINEDNLIEAFVARGFEVVEPEYLSFVEQVKLFRETEMVVGPGGAGLFNVFFCNYGTRVISIESSTAFVHWHAELFGSLGLRYGIVLGAQDLLDNTPTQKRWAVDVKGVMSAVDLF
jgi:capsular polysaccharide biosynthesis protein